MVAGRAVRDSTETGARSAELDVNVSAIMRIARGADWADMVAGRAELSGAGATDEQAVDEIGTDLTDVVAGGAELDSISSTWANTVAGRVELDSSPSAIDGISSAMGDSTETVAGSAELDVNARTIMRMGREADGADTVAGRAELNLSPSAIDGISSAIVSGEDWTVVGADGAKLELTPRTILLGADLAEMVASGAGATDGQVVDGIGTDLTEVVAGGAELDSIPSTFLMVANRARATPGQAVEQQKTGMHLAACGAGSSEVPRGAEGASQTVTHQLMWAHAHTHARAQAHTRAHTHTRTHASTHTHEHTSTQACARARAHTHGHTHTWISRERADERARALREAGERERANGNESAGEGGRDPGNACGVERTSRDESERGRVGGGTASAESCRAQDESESDRERASGREPGEGGQDDGGVREVRVRGSMGVRERWRDATAPERAWRGESGDVESDFLMGRLSAAHATGFLVAADKDWQCGLCQTDDREDSVGGYLPILQCFSCLFTCHAACYHDDGSQLFHEAVARCEPECEHPDGTWRCGDCDSAASPVTSIFRWFFTASPSSPPAQSSRIPRQHHHLRSKCAWCHLWSDRATCLCGWKKFFHLRRVVTPALFPDNIGTVYDSGFCACGCWRPQWLWTEETTLCASRFLGRLPETTTGAVVEFVLALTASFNTRRRHRCRFSGSGGVGTEVGTMVSLQRFASGFEGRPAVLPNQGNTCFLASALQLLARASHFCTLVDGLPGPLSRKLSPVLHGIRDEKSTRAPRRIALFTNLITWLCNERMITARRKEDAMEVIVRILAALYEEADEQDQERLSALFSHETILRLTCVTCGNTDLKSEKHWYQGIHPNDNGVPDIAAGLRASVTEIVTRQCPLTSCNGQSAESQCLPILGSGGEYRLIHIVQQWRRRPSELGVGTVAPRSARSSAQSGLVLSQAEAQPSITIANASYNQRWILLGAIEHVPTWGGHYVAHVKGAGRSWYTANDGSLREYHELLPSHLLQKSYGLLYGRAPKSVEHQLRLADEEPCFDCDVPGCSNGFNPSAVTTRQSLWLTGQLGLYAVREIQAGEYVASFGKLRRCEAPGAASSRQRFEVRGKHGTVYLKWLRSDAHNLGQFANTTCCATHLNAKIVYNGLVGGNGQAWVQVTKKVRRGAEVLVHYGGGFFSRLDECRCCVCAGTCHGAVARPPPPFSLP